MSKEFKVIEAGGWAVLIAVGDCGIDAAMIHKAMDPSNPASQEQEVGTTNPEVNDTEEGSDE